MSNIYLKVIIETFSKLRFTEFKKFVHFETSCCNLKIRDLLFFYYFNFERNYDLLKSKRLCILSKKSINLKKKTSKIEICTTYFLQKEFFKDLCFMSMHSALNTLSEYTQKTLLHKLLLLVFKFLESI